MGGPGARTGNHGRHLMTRFVEQNLSIGFEPNGDGDAITQAFLGTFGPLIGNVSEFHIDGTRVPGALTPGQYRTWAPRAQGFNGRFHHLRAHTSRGLHLTVGGQATSDTDWVPFIELEDRKGPADLTPDVWRAQMRDFLQVALHYAAEPAVTRLSIRNTLGSRWTPAVPGAEAQEYVRLIPHPERVAAFYPDPLAYWASWDRIDAVGNRRLASRATDAVDVPTYERSVYPRLWELARRAYPGHCQYFPPTIVPRDSAEELALFRHGDALVRWVGYDPVTRTARASCYAGEGQHLPPHEVLGLDAMLRDRKMPDGAPLDDLQIIFPSREMALQEGVPLLDIGVTVLYMTPNLTDARLTADDYRTPVPH